MKYKTALSISIGLLIGTAIWNFCSSSSIKQNEPIEQTLSEKEKQEIIGELERFLEFRKTKGHTEGEWEQFGEVIEMAVKTRDPRMAPLLLKCLDQKLAALSLIKIGKESIPGLMNAVNDPDRFVRTNAVFALSEIVYKTGIADLKERDEIKNIFMKALQVKKGVVRKEAVYGLGNFPDPDVIPLIKEISEKDPYTKKQAFKGRAETIFPVREEAQKVLEKFKAEGKIK